MALNLFRQIVSIVLFVYVKVGVCTSIHCHSYYQVPLSLPSTPPSAVMATELEYSMRAQA